MERWRGGLLTREPMLVKYRFDTSTNKFRERCVQTYWHYCADLINFVIRQAPDFLLEDWREFPQHEEECWIGLRSQCMTWHIVVCHMCSRYLTSVSGVDNLKRLQWAGKLHLAILSMHQENSCVVEVSPLGDGSTDTFLLKLALRANIPLWISQFLPVKSPSLWHFLPIFKLCAMTQPIDRVPSMYRQIGRP